MEDENNLNRDPFVEDVPTKYEKWLHEVFNQQMNVIGALLMKVRELDERMKAHEQVHLASSRDIMRHADPVKKEEKPH